MEIYNFPQELIRAMHSTTFMTVGSKNTINYSPKVVYHCAFDAIHCVRETELLAVVSNFPPKFVLRSSNGCVTLVQIKGIFSPKATPIWSCQPGVFESATESLQWSIQN